MARTTKRASANEMLEVLKKNWLNTSDIRILACVGNERARTIKKEITDELINKNCFVPPGLVPSEEVIKYLNLNVKYLKKISE